MRSVLIVVVGVVLACSQQASTEVNEPEPPAAEPAVEAAEPATDAADDEKKPMAGHASCCDGGDCRDELYASQREWQAACKQAGQTPGNWCPETCAFMATSDPPECGC